MTKASVAIAAVVAAAGNDCNNGNQGSGIDSSSNDGDCGDGNCDSNGGSSSDGYSNGISKATKTVAITAMVGGRNNQLIREQWKQQW